MTGLPVLNFDKNVGISDFYVWIWNDLEKSE